MKFDRIFRKGGIFQPESSGVLRKKSTTVSCFRLSASVLALSVLLSACGDPFDEENASPDNPNTSAIVKTPGQTAYENQCAGCHGADGSGTALYTGVKRSLTFAEIESIIATSMPPEAPGECNGTCAAYTAEYIFSTFTTAPTAVSIEPPTGKSLYLAGCAQCHGDIGEGVGNIPGVTRDLSIADLKAIVATRMPPDAPGACVGECAALTAAYVFYNFAIPDLTTDLDPLPGDSNPALPTPIPTVPTPLTPPPVSANGESVYTSYCASCHGVDGLGVGTVIGLTRDLGEAELASIINNTMPANDPALCINNCALNVARYVLDNFTVPVIIPPPVPPTGAEVYTAVCATCHGLDGRGVAPVPGVTRNMSVAELAGIINSTMPEADPSLCTAACATDVAKYIFDNFTVLAELPTPGTGGTQPVPAQPAPVLPATSVGETLYSSQGCAGCHGINGQGIGVVGGLTRNLTLATLTSINELTMPPEDPSLCTGSCAADIAAYIFENLTDPATPLATNEHPLADLPSGQVQTNIACARMAQSGDSNVVRDLFCTANPPTITSLRQLQAGLGLGFANPNALGRRNNGRQGNPGFAFTGHSTSVVSKFVNAINPRAILFGPAGPGFISMGFVRGDKFVELVTRDRARNQLTFFLVVFEQTCDVTNSCTYGDILTPAIERSWTNVTLYSEDDLKNTILDCRQCHQVNGPGTHKILRMQELRNPWNHWFRDNRDGGTALLSDFFAARGTGEEYAGIPAALINASDPANLEDFVANNGFANQPNIFNSTQIEREVIQSSPGQPANNDRPGTSRTWDALYNASSQGLFITAPYHDVKVTDSSKLALLTQTYQNYLNGLIARSSLPDLRDAFLDSRLFEIGFAVAPGLSANNILLQACAQCHNSRLDQSISRARFNVNLNAMSDTNGGVLTDVARDFEIGITIDRLQLPRDDLRIMPPSLTSRDLTPAEIARVVTFLCSQTTTPITQCL